MCLLVGMEVNPTAFGYTERKMHYFFLWSLKRGNNLVQKWDKQENNVDERKSFNK